MKIKLYSSYDHFTWNRTPTYIEWTREEAPIKCYVNEYVQKVETPAEESIAILIEPRTIIPETYAWIENHMDRFKYVFTHESKLEEKYENAMLFIFGGVYSYSDELKTKNISMICGNKNMCQLHMERMKLADRLEKLGVDILGTYKGSWVSTHNAHAPYRFSVVIENSNNPGDFWITEKFCNCLANRTIPIYYGSNYVNVNFNPDGIIYVKDLKDIVEIAMNLDPEEEYIKRLDAVEDNWERIKDFECFEDLFYRNYGEMLRKMERNIRNDES